VLVEKPGDLALSTQPDPARPEQGQPDDDAEEGSPRPRAVTERGWTVEPSPPPVFPIAPGASSDAPDGSRAAPPLPIGSLPQLKAALARTEKSREASSRGAAVASPAQGPIAVEVSNDLPATSGVIVGGRDGDPPRATPRSRADTPARVVVDEGWTAGVLRSTAAPAAPMSGTGRAPVAAVAVPMPPPLRAAHAPAISIPPLAKAAPAPAEAATPPETPPAPVRRALEPPAGVISRGFPRSAAERAGAAASRTTRVSPPALPRDGRRASVPARSAASLSPRVSQALESIEPPIRVAQGSVTAPLPSAGRRRPPTVELPTLESTEPTPPGPDRVSIARARASRRPAPPEPARVLPSIFSVIDRRHAPPGSQPAAEVHAPRIIAPAAAAVSAPAMAEPIRPAPVRELEPLRASKPPPTDGPAFLSDPAPASQAGPARTGPAQAGPARVSRPADPAPAPSSSAPRARQRRAGSFSEADAAFFRAGEEMEQGDHELFDDAPDPAYSLKRPALWRRITGRHRSG